MRMLKALVLLITGVSVLVCAISGYTLQSTVDGWAIVPMGTSERVILGPFALSMTIIGAILVFKRQ
jgi:hypothetical protein